MRIIKFILFLVYTFISITTIGAQYKFQSVLPGIDGNELILKLQENYTPAQVLNYSMARDTLYAKIDNEKDSVHCIYTDYSIYLPHNTDPTSYLFSNGINAEHLYPVSKGTETGFAKSDMHHIFPSKVNVNSDRASYEFDEIKDNLTQKWYYKEAILNTIPLQNKDFYSEYANQYFEPRENKKGDIARAMFYIKTMYREQTDAADPSFFEHQKDTLCKWHFQDPVDSIEWVRTWKISKYQDGKPNPFVLDCSLASRTYCEFLSDQCLKVGVIELAEARKISVKLSPIPVFDNLNVSIENNGSKFLEIRVYDVVGFYVYNLRINIKGDQVTEINIPMQNMTNGVYLMEVRGITDKIISRVFKKIIKI
ncbi:MAG: endonuclease [Deltaproteobacteria bacterium]